jgi:hypothetical protein
MIHLFNEVKSQVLCFPIVLSVLLGYAGGAHVRVAAVGLAAENRGFDR